MKRIQIAILAGFLILVPVIVMAVLGASAQTPLGTSADRAEILKFRAAHNVAANKHDAKGMAILYAPDGDRISAAGVHYIGRDQIEQSYVRLFNGAGENGVLKDESSTLRFLTADVALIDVDDVTTGREDGPVRHHVASIYVKRNGRWTMVAERATLKQ